MTHGLRWIGWIAVFALCAVASAQARTDDLARRVERWHKLWAAGRVDVEAAIQDPRDGARLYGEGVVPERAARPMRHADALAELVHRALAAPDEDRVLAVLDLAAIGLDGKPVDTALAPATVRELAHRALGRATEPSVLDLLVRHADAAERELGRRVAAVRALGLVDRAVLRVFLERALDDGERLVRLAAAEALAARAHPGSVGALSRRLVVEQDATVGQALVLGIHRAVRAHGAAVDAATLRRATVTAIEALGRFDWRADVGIVDLLHDLRTTMAIEPLIDVLARFTARRRDASDSTILRDRAHRTLESLTGTRRDATDVAGWRAFWAAERESFVIAPERTERDDAGRTTTGFFGIPVRGSRVVFVIDVSGSMNAALSRAPTGTSDRDLEEGTRLSFAKRELLAAVDELPADARFGVIVYSNGVRRWGSRLVSPRPEMKAALRGMLAELVPRGGTNLWGGLSAALGADEGSWGTIDPDGADEVFLLTDGQPTVGDLIDPAAILTAVGDANRYLHARIHTVSLGGDARFLEQLATDNGGRFVQY